MTASNVRGAHPGRSSLAAGDVESIAEETLELVRANGIAFRRGEPLDYFRRLARLGAALTLPIVPPASLRRSVFLKVLYPLWNIVVDDEIDRDGTTRELNASVAFLIAAPAPASAAGAILARFADLLPDGSLSRSSAVGFGVWEAVHGFAYEHFINKNPALATPFEYRRYSTMTASLKLFLDIDLGLADRVPGAPVRRRLRQAYDDLSCAIKLASDIGTLRREVHEENSMSLLRILAGSGERQDPFTERQANEAVAEALRFKDEVAALAHAHMRSARQMCGEAPEVDTSAVLTAVGKIVDVYASGIDPFFDS